MRELTENTLHILIHELKDPLTIIKGTSELLKDKSNSPKEIKEFSNVIQEQADYANYLLNNISTFNKLQDNIPIVLYNEETDLKEVTNQIVNLYKKKNPKIKWINNLNNNIKVYTDPSMLKIILFNLIRNSSKYTLKGSVTIDAQKTENEVIWKIKDTGIGIEKNKIKHITEIYYRASDEFPGTGIGLYLVGQICKKLNINMSVESELNIGTEIILTFKNNSKEN